MKRSRTLPLLLCLLVCAGDSALGQSWSQLGPQARYAQSMVFDPNSGRMIVFAGLQPDSGSSLNDVWTGQMTTSSLNFSRVTPAGSAPAVRYGHSATYDAANNRMTVFGGATGSAATCANDTWVLDGANGEGSSPAWTQNAASGTLPAARLRQASVYDPNTNTLIVFGGNNCSATYYNDVWVLSNANGLGGASRWTQLSPTGTKPAKRQGAAAVYDALDNRLIVFGGDAGSSPFNSVFVLSNANGSGGTPAWTQLSPTGTKPSSRSGAGAVYDSANNRMMVFGGASLSSTFSDTWILTFANGLGGAPAWIKATPSGTAPNLAYHSAVYDPVANSMYVFGGTDPTNLKLQSSDHAFLLTNANGLQPGAHWYVGVPAVRYSQSAFYDPSSDSLFIFGGQHSENSGNFGDYAQEAGAMTSPGLNWTLVNPGSGPGARFAHSGLYDQGSNRMLLFGGAAGFPAPCRSDYWVLKNANNASPGARWLSVRTSGTAPAARMRHAAAYDAATNTMIVFGGYDCASTYFNDVWTLSNATNVSGTSTWTKLSVSGTPPAARESSSAMYDSANNLLIVFGGDSGTAQYGDLWLLSHANGSGGAPAWTRVTASTGGPVARSGHVAVYDAANNIMTVQGGFDGANVLADTWTLSGANGTAGTPAWTQIASGQPRRFHSAVYDPVSGQMVIFGGATGVYPSQYPSSDVYVLSHANGQ